MFVGITNSPRDYAWGSTSAIASVLGRQPSGAPEAELWLGTHPGSPSRLVDGSGTLADVATLPFLLKVLAAASPLSLQAHPTMAQAQAGFARENVAGIPLDSPLRNYRDPLHKPELIFALADGFRALCGFRAAAETAATIARLKAARPGDAALGNWSARLAADADIRPCFEWLISNGAGVAELVQSVIAAAALLDGPRFELVGELAEAYPGDPGIVISLMLNLVTLRRGEVLYLPAGNIHAYVEGVGIELMAASDNVVRGGLTQKHVDVAELLSVLDFTPRDVPYLAGIAAADGVTVFRPDVPDFELVRVTASAVVPLAGPAIVLCISGAFALAGGAGGSGGVSGAGDPGVFAGAGAAVSSVRAVSGVAAVSAGEAVYVSADEAAVRLTGSGELFLATVGR